MYTLLDLFGDLGGVKAILVMVFGMLIFPFSKFSFVMAASNLLYFAKHSNPEGEELGLKRDASGEDIGLKRDEDLLLQVKKYPKIHEELGMHYSGSLTLSESLNLFSMVFLRSIGCGCCVKSDKKSDIYLKLHDKSLKKLDDSLNALEIIK